VGVVRRPDVLCLQETKLAMPPSAYGLFRLGYDSVHHGSGQWNGVAILSRVGLESPVMGFATVPTPTLTRG